MIQIEIHMDRAYYGRYPDHHGISKMVKIAAGAELTIVPATGEYKLGAAALFGVTVSGRKGDD